MKNAPEEIEAQVAGVVAAVMSQHGSRRELVVNQPWDSLEKTEIILSVEEFYSIDFPADLLDSLNSESEIVAALLEILSDCE